MIETMRKVLITGASKGIGAATALAFAKEQAALTLHYGMDRGGAEQTAEQCRAHGAVVDLVGAELTTIEGVHGFCEALRGRSFDVLINNAGSLIGRKKLTEMPGEHWERTVMLNLSSVFYITQAVVGHMIEQKRGWIVNLGSIAGRNGGGPGAIAYATCKGAVSTLTKGMAKEFAPSGIQVNCVSPGTITTNFHEVFSTPQMLEAMRATAASGRLGTSEETADVIYYLCSPQAAYIHGQTIEVNGGMYFA